MPATYHNVSPEIWTRQLRAISNESKVVYFYILTCRERVSEGLFSLSPESLAAAVSLDLSDVFLAIEELQMAGLITWDIDSELVLDRNALRTNPVPGPRPGKRPDGRAAAFAKRFVRLPRASILNEFLALAAMHSPYLVRVIEEERSQIYDLVSGDEANTESPPHSEGLPAAGPTAAPIATSTGLPARPPRGEPSPPVNDPLRGEERRLEVSRDEASQGEQKGEKDPAPADGFTAVSSRPPGSAATRTRKCERCGWEIARESICACRGPQVNWGAREGI